jgi:hypothetical protein
MNLILCPLVVTNPALYSHSFQMYTLIRFDASAFHSTTAMRNMTNGINPY